MTQAGGPVRQVCPICARRRQSSFHARIQPDPDADAAARHATRSATVPTDSFDPQTSSSTKTTIGNVAHGRSINCSIDPYLKRFDVVVWYVATPAVKRVSRQIV
jgi:hypothetical protein